MNCKTKKIAIQRGDYAKEFLTEKNISFTEISTENFAEAIVSVVSGQADAMIGDEQIVLHFLYSHDMHRELKIVGEPLYVGLSAMAVKDGNRLLQSILNKGIDHARATGMLERLNQKWIGTHLPDPAVTPTSWWALWSYAAVFAGLLVAVGLYNLHLRRVVTAKTSELKRSEQRLNAVIAGTGAGAWEWNLKTGETYFNERWAEMLGYRLAELKSTNIEVWQGLTHPEDLLKAESILKRHCEGELDEYRCEMRMRHKQGHWVWILDRGKVYEYAADGSPLLMAGTHVDISARKQAEDALRESEERNRALLQAIPDLIFVMNDQGLLLDCHAGDLSKLALPPDQFINRALSDVLPENIATDAMECVARTRRTGETAVHEYQLEVAGEARWFESRIVSCGDMAIVSIVRDVSDRKTMELALEKKTREMEQFVYIVSHDLKSPLVTIKTFLKMLQEDIHNNDQEKISKDLEFLHSAANKVETLLGALLKLSRVGRANAPAKTLSASELVDDCLKTLGGILQRQKVEVVVGVMPFALHGDPLHFGQIWQNLIENAVKYMGDQQQPSIEVGVRQQDKDLLFYVRDNGMGIALNHQQHVFGIFAQLDRSSEGIGLGLALVRKLVAIYGGRIWVESAGEGKGSCFWFTLPGAIR